MIMLMDACAESPNSDKRRLMVEQQLLPRGIQDQNVLDAMAEVPREHFVPETAQAYAYEDSPLPLLCGQTISQPYIVAYMCELLQLGSPGRILDIGSGSGYQAAVLAAMGHDVIGVELIPELADFARSRLAELPYGRKVDIHVGDGCLGWPDNAPYDGIVVAAAAAKVPPALPAQLRDNARLVIPCGSRRIQEMQTVTRLPGAKIKLRRGIACRFVPLLGVNGFQEGES